jgi:hypothetical protein
MSTEWYFFAFDHDSIVKHLTSPIAEAVESADALKWSRIMKALDKVHPPGQISKYAINGCERPVTAVEWYSNRPALPRNAPPTAGAESVDTLLKISLEALARYRLVGTCFKPLGVFSELGYPARLASDKERVEFGAFRQALFDWRSAQPEPYGFVSRTNQQAAVALPDAVRRLAAVEADVGLLRRLASELATGEWKQLAFDLRSLRAFVELAAAEGLAIYFRADGT